MAQFWYTTKRMNNNTTFSINASLGFAWNTFKRHGWFLVGTFLLTIVISFVLGSLSDGRSDFGSFTGNLLSLIVSMLISISWTTIAVRYAHNQTVVFKDLFSRYNVFWKYVGASILYGLIILGGLILLIIPGIIWAIKYKMYSYLIIEKGLGIRESLRESARMTKGSKWKLFWFTILAGLINLVGVLALGVGFLITAPVIMIAQAHIYKSLKDRVGKEPVEETTTVITEAEVVTE